MYGSVLALIGLMVGGEPIVLENDVVEIQFSKFKIPCRVDPSQQDKIATVRLFVSEDHGKTWKHAKDGTLTDSTFTFFASGDGLYWFAVQMMYKDDRRFPAELKDLAPALKVYVNTERKALQRPPAPAPPPPPTPDPLFSPPARKTSNSQQTVEQWQQKAEQLAIIVAYLRAKIMEPPQRQERKDQQQLEKLQHEMKELRTTVEQLRQRVAELEAERKTK